MKFIYSKKLTKQQKEALQYHSEWLSNGINLIAAHVKKHKGYVDAMTKLEARHAELEVAASAGNEDASIKLHGVTDQRMRLGRSIESARNESWGDAMALRTPINNTQQLLGFVIQDFATQIEDALEEALAPFFARRDRARYAARDNDLIRALGIYLAPPIGNSVAELHPVAECYINAIAQLLAGDVVWEYSGAPAKDSAPATAVAA